MKRPDKLEPFQPSSNALAFYPCMSDKKKLVLIIDTYSQDYITFLSK